MIRRRDMLGAGGFALFASATSAGAVAFRHLQHPVPAGGDRVLTELPQHLGNWSLQAAREDMVDPVEIDVAFGAALQMYDRVVERDYVAAGLPRVMLNIAYKREIRQEDRFHWPEFCYATQGFQVTRLAPFALGDVAPGVLVSRFVGERAGRRELVGYLLRVGDGMASGSLAVRSSLFRQSLALRVPDGVMSRASFLIDAFGSDDIAAATDLLAGFLRLLLARSGGALRTMLVR